MSDGHLTVGEMRTTLAALPGDAPLVVVVRDDDGQEMWADSVSLGVVGDARWRATYACVDAYVRARVDWEWSPGGADEECDDIPF